MCRNKTEPEKKKEIKDFLQLQYKNLGPIKYSKFF